LAVTIHASLQGKFAMWLLVNRSAMSALIGLTVLTDCKPARTPDRDTARAGLSVAEQRAPTAASTTVSTAANDTTTAGALVTSPPPDANQAADTSVNAPGLQCSPKVFSVHDTITLRMENPHGEYLMVYAPDSTVFYLSQPDPRADVLMPSDSFSVTPIVRFRADVMADPGGYYPRPVFRDTGNYVLVIGHNMASEAGSDIYRCTIRHRAER
jgi:hypothetical protein